MKKIIFYGEISNKLKITTLVEKDNKKFILMEMGYSRIKKGEFNNVLPLLNEEKVHCTFLYAVTEGRQPGRIYVDNLLQPKAYLIICRSGKYLVAVDISNTTFNEFLSDYLYNRKIIVITLTFIAHHMNGLLN